MSASRIVACLAAALLIVACGPKAVPPTHTPTRASEGVSQGEPAELSQPPQATQPEGSSIPPPTEAPAAVPTEPFELNGISFTSVPSGDRLGCKEPLYVARPEEREGSPLDFTATYLPPGFTMQLTGADSCDGRVASLGTVYTDGQRRINIARWTMRVFPMPTVAPHPVEVAGKPGVRLGTDVLLVEEWGMTAIEVTGMPYEETVKIAEGLRSAGEPQTFRPRIKSLNNVFVTQKGMELGPERSKPTMWAEGFSRVGMILSEPVDLSNPVRAALVTYDADIPDRTLFWLQVRGKTDDGTWTEWSMVEKNHVVIQLKALSRFVEYWIHLVANDTTPTVRDVTITPLR